MVESTFVSLHAARIEEDSGSVSQVAPFAFTVIYNELNMIIYTQPVFWSVDAA